MNWVRVDELCDHSWPWQKGVVLNDRLLLGQDRGKSIYRYDGEKKIKVFECMELIEGTHSCCFFDGYTYFLFGQKWKATSGNSYLYRSKTGNSGDWKLFQIFHNVQNVRAITSFDDELYIGADNILYQLSKG
ncbi:hypothetical protein ES705_31501 [subsurface metagenome]